MKKIAIIGSGTAASLTAAGYYHEFKNDCEIEIYHDPKVNIEPVGQATVLTVPRIFFDSFGWTWYDNPVKATIKTGASYETGERKTITSSMDSLWIRLVCISYLVCFLTFY